MEERVGVKVRKNWKMLQLQIKGGRANWGKSEKKLEDAPIADERWKSELGQK